MMPTTMQTSDMDFEKVILGYFGFLAIMNYFGLFMRCELNTVTFHKKRFINFFEQFY